MISARPLSADWKTAKKPASQMTREMVDSFIRRSEMEARSSEEILESELCSRGAAYCALANQMNMLRTATSEMRLRTKIHRMLSVRG